MKEVKLNASNLHKEVYNKVVELYPKETVKQEVTIKINGKSLYLDIYLPRLKIAFECNGRQHFKFNKFFHKDASSLKKQKENDNLKRLYCEELGITLVDINYNDKITKEFVEYKTLEALRLT